MQKKALFVAMFCGALCLTGCLKNVESESVTQVRLAKADQLKAEASLLQAQASAETVLASAQAELIKAQAALTKAEADKVAAETAYQQVLNDLKAVEVQLKQVEVESAKVDLQMKKAELEARQAELEVIIANSKMELERVALELQAIKASMAVDAVQQALALAQAEKAMQDFLIAQKQEEVEAIMGIAYKYFDLQNQILEMEIAIFENEVMISNLQAGIVDPAEALADEIAKAQRELARMEHIKAIAESYLTYDEETMKDAKAEYTGLLITAQNDLLEANIAFEEYLDDYNTALNAISNTYYYSYDRDAYNWFGVFAYLNSLGAREQYVEYDTEKYARGYQWGYYDENDEWVVLHTEQYTEYEIDYHRPDAETVAEYEEKGIYLPDDAIYEWKYNRIPAKTDVEAVNAFIDAHVKNMEAEAQEAKDAAAKQAEAVAEVAKGRLEMINSIVATTQEYVDGLKEKFEAADSDKESTFDAAISASAASMQAVADLMIANIDNAEVEEALAVLKDAQEDQTAKKQAYTEAQGKTADAKNDLQNEEFNFVTEYGGADMAEAEFNRDMAIATANNDMKVKQAAVTDAIVNAYTDAQEATALAKGAVKTAQAAVETKLGIWRSAKIALANDPTNETLKKAEADAHDAYDTAVADVATAEANVTIAVGKEATAKADYDAVNEPYQAAVKALKTLNDKKADWDAKLAKAKKDVADAETAEEAAKKASEDADKAVEDAVKALEEAGEALAADEKKALAEAMEANFIAWDKYNKASAAVEDLENTYRHYRRDAEALDEETGWLILLQEEATEACQELWADYDGDGIEEPYAEYIQSIDEELAGIVEDAEEVKAKIAKYDTQYRPAYVEAIEAVNAMEDKYSELEFAVYDAEDVVTILEYTVNMLGECTFVDENGDIVSVEEYIANIEQEEQALIDNINALGQAIVDNNNDASIQIARLQNMNAHYEELIALYSALVEKYGEILNNFMEELSDEE